jgi:hypothetical protein
MKFLKLSMIFFTISSCGIKNNKHKKAISISQDNSITKDLTKFWDVKFEDAFKVKPGIKSCSDDYSNINNCYNKLAPATPSILRNLSSSKYNEYSNGKALLHQPADNAITADARILLKANNNHQFDFYNGNTSITKHLPTLFLVMPAIIVRDTFNEQSI